MMMQHAILDVRSMLGMTDQDLLRYGRKTALYVQLLRWQAESPISFSVPSAWAVPADFRKKFIENEVRRAFYGLTHGITTDCVLMARGSSLYERSGQSPTLFCRYNPEDRESSYRLFEATFRKVHESDPSMGVLLTIMEGGLSVFEDGSRAIGWNNISFVADTHSPADPEEMIIHAVHGLGTRAVQGGDKVIVLTADRDLGAITSFRTATKERAIAVGASQQSCYQVSDYRQREADFFHLGRGELASRELQGIDLLGRMEAYVDDSGQLGEVPLVQTCHSISAGMNPFGNKQQVSNLIGILQYLARQGEGCWQAEGAFPSVQEDMPSIYQLHKTSIPPTREGSLCVEKRHLYSQHYVVGSGEYTGPLIVATVFRDIFRERGFGQFRRLDERFKAGYTLLVGGHMPEFIQETPNCRCRLSRQPEHLGSHATTYTRDMIDEHPGEVYLLASGIQAEQDDGYRIAGIKPNEVYMDDEGRPIRIFHRAHLDSNGREAAVEIFSKSWGETLKGWFRRPPHP